MQLLIHIDMFNFDIACECNYFNLNSGAKWQFCSLVARSHGIIGCENWKRENIYDKTVFSSFAHFFLSHLWHILDLWLQSHSYH